MNMRRSWYVCIKQYHNLAKLVLWVVFFWGGGGGGGGLFSFYQNLELQPPLLY